MQHVKMHVQTSSCECAPGVTQLDHACERCLHPLIPCMALMSRSWEEGVRARWWRSSTKRASAASSAARRSARFCGCTIWSCASASLCTVCRWRTYVVAHSPRSCAAPAGASVTCAARRPAWGRSQGGMGGMRVSLATPHGHVQPPYAPVARSGPEVCQHYATVLVAGTSPRQEHTHQ